MTKKTETQKNYSYIIKTKTGETYWPEELEGNTKDINAILTLKGHYKDGKAWQREIIRGECIEISYENPEQQNSTEEETE